MRLTPSEIVVLRGTSFAKEAVIEPWSEPVVGGGKASSEELTHAAIMAALLANRSVGLVQLTLGADPGGTHAMQAWVSRTRDIHPEAWPEPSLESHIARFAGPAPRTVYDAITAWQSRIWRALIWQATPHQIKRYLVLRGVILADDGADDAPGISYPCHLSPEMAGALSQVPVEPVQHMLHTCKTHEPELWRYLDRGIWLWGQMGVPS